VGGRIPERKGRKSIGVDLIQPEIVRMASFSWVSNSRVYALCHQAWEQYSAGAYTKALVEVLSKLNEHPQVRPARRFIKAIRDETLFFKFQNVVFESETSIKNDTQVCRIIAKWWDLSWRGF